MTLRKGFFSFLLSFLFCALYAQTTAVYTEANLAYKRGEDFYAKGIFGLAQNEYRTAIQMLRPITEPEWKILKTNAELQYAKCAVRLNQPDAEKLVVDFLRENAPSPSASQAALEIGDYYFNAKEYDKALEYYDMAPSGSGAQANEIKFKKGYALFVSKKFSQAKTAFGSIKDNSGSEWYYPANYYYGCCQFYEGRYDDAAKAFERCEGSSKYKSYVPYYLCQIYFAQKKYDQVISYGAPKANDSNLKNKAEMNQLIGQAYYEKGDYKKALPYLEYGVENSNNTRAADFYQIGYTQYQTGHYKEAIQNFEQLTKQDSLLGQNGLYHLGDCYVKVGNKQSARNAFGQAAALNYDKSVKEEALINYAKLSYELKYDRDAITALQSIAPDSKHYPDAQALMSEIFLNTRDYDRAISTLEGIKNRDSKLDATYQTVTYLRGLQLYQSGMKDEARRYFNKSQDFPSDRKTTALCSYWIGSIANENGEYETSKSHIQSFLSNAKSIPDLPDESSLLMGNYIQGYNNLKLKDYSAALNNFTATVDGIKRNQDEIYLDQVKTDILGDAVLRAGDCHFKRNQYDSALKYYNEAFSQKYKGFEYALYQKAIIKGLQKNPTDKIIALEDLVKKYPKSQFTDEALFQLGTTYQDLNQLDKAVPPFKQLVTDFRGKSGLYNQALLQLGLISYNKGDAQTAINYYKQVFSNNPENSEAKDALAALEEIYVKDLGKPDEYFAFLETVPGYKVDNIAKDSVSFNAAENQFVNGQFEKAIDSYTTYIAKFPNGRNTITAYYHRGESYASNNIKKYAAALKDYATVINRGQSKYYAKSCEKASLLAYNSEKDFAAAYEYGKKWEDAASTENSKFDAQIICLRAAYRLNNAMAVNEYAKKIIDSGSASNDQMASANFYLGKVSYDKGDYPKAFNALEKVTKLTDTEIMAESYHLLAQIQYKQKKYDATEEFIGNANKASAGYQDWIARNIILLSDVYVAKEDPNSAKAALEAIIENYKGDDKEIKDMAQKKYEALNGASSSKGTNKSKSPTSNLLELDDN